MNKTWIGVGIGIVVLLLGAAAFPLSNLGERSAPEELVAAVDDGDLQALLPVYATKCLDCHSERGELPFYAGLPVASSMIEEHQQAARARFDFDREVFSTDEPVTEATLAKLHHEIAAGTMPPSSYTALHWSAGWNDEDQVLQQAWARHTRARRDGAADLDDPAYDQPIYPIKLVEGLDADKVALGKALYHDVRLSTDDTISCASCHDLARGGTDLAQYSTGVDEQLGGINSPTTYNSAYFLAQFWDGRAADLAEQAAGPPNNPIEMASSWEEILGKLGEDEAMVEAFTATYGEITSEAITDAIATFEMTLNTPGSAFDRYLVGDGDALSAEQLAGYERFDSHGCDTCHVGAAMGGTSFEIMGVHADYMGDRGDPTDADLGRFGVTRDERDRHRFKVPTLRNVALTPPYYHDGTVETLDDAVRKMGTYERGTALSDDEVVQIVAFLEAQTGMVDGVLLQ
jgi:cytochrome c peroxidase